MDEIVDDMQRLIFFIFALTLAVAPVPLGSNRAWSWSPLGVVVGVLLLAWSLTTYLRADEQRRHVISFKTLGVPAVLTVLVLGWAAVQTSGWTPSAWATPISANVAFGLPLGNRGVAFEKEAALTAILHILTYAGMFLLAASLSSNASGARRLLGTVVVSAVFGTLYAMIADVINQRTPITGFSVWVPHRYFFSGTFANSNNYATYTGVAAMTALVLAIRPRRSGDRRESAGQRWRRRIDSLIGRGGAWMAAALILITGVLLSGSRAGWISLALAVTAMVALYARGVWRLVFGMLMPIFFALLAAALPGGEKLIARVLALVDQGESGRALIFPMTLDAIGLRPILGWGLNSFASLYTVFQPPTLVSYFDKVHNTYLELAFDLGIPAAVMLVLAVVWLVVRCFIGFVTRGRDRELAGLGFFAGVLVGTHSLFDFSLQIPGTAGTFFATLGVAWAQSWSRQQEP